MRKLSCVLLKEQTNVHSGLISVNVKMTNFSLTDHVDSPHGSLLIEDYQKHIVSNESIQLASSHAHVTKGSIVG